MWLLWKTTLAPGPLKGVNQCAKWDTCTLGVWQGATLVPRGLMLQSQGQFQKSLCSNSRGFEVMNLVNAGKPQLDNVLLMRMNYGLCSLLWSLDLPFSGWGTLWQETRNGTIGPPGFQKQILP
ncbi:uncharacterized protein LOC141952717 isoform X5 [Strix uralensis]|uniref:uncharacterized protein LOC141949235 isoform X2 n=1 Tax=Strix uralensis TaxID=36305 RepID=UPI003DA68A08